MEIKNKVVIVTGASEGIGEALARALHREGAKVVLAARSEEKIGKLAHEMHGTLAVHTDMRKEDDVRNLIDRAMEVFGRIDILVNNAGQGLYGPIESVDLKQYREVIELNVVAPLLAMQLVIPIMRTQGGGMILNISSRVSKNYYPQLGAYASTKYALNALSLTGRAELEKDGIIISVMHPKMTSTRFGANAITAGQTESAARTPGTGAPRPGMQVDTAEDVAEKTLELIKSENPEAEM